MTGHLFNAAVLELRALRRDLSRALRDDNAVDQALASLWPALPSRFVDDISSELARRAFTRRSAPWLTRNMR